MMRIAEPKVRIHSPPAASHQRTSTADLANRMRITSQPRVPDPLAQRRLIARAAEIGKSWAELPGTRHRAYLQRRSNALSSGPLSMSFRPVSDEGPSGDPCQERASTG